MPQPYNIVLIRHAQSLFNQLTTKQCNNLKLIFNSWEEILKNTEFLQRVPYNQLLIDSPLSEKGKIQCKKYREECALINPNLILVSPYRRALQTCNLLFPNPKNTKILVQPILAQVFRYSCDVPSQWHQNKHLFPNFDFTKIQPLGNHWYQSNLHQQIKQKINTTLQQKNINHFQDEKILLLQMLKNQQIHQSPKMLRSRAALIKQLLAEYQKIYPTIVIISHYYLIGSLVAKQFDEEGNLPEQIDIKNCYPYYHLLQELLKVT